MYNLKLNQLFSVKITVISNDEDQGPNAIRLPPGLSPYNLLTVFEQYRTDKYYVLSTAFACFPSFRGVLQQRLSYR